MRSKHPSLEAGSLVFRLCLNTDMSLSFTKRFLANFSMGSEKSKATPWAFGFFCLTIVSSRPSPVPKSRTRLTVSGICSNSAFLISSS